MPLKTEYVYIYIDKRLQPLLEALLKEKDVQLGLLERGFKADAQGVAKYAVYKLLVDKGMFSPAKDKPSHSKGQ